MFSFWIGPTFKQYAIVTISNFAFLHIGMSISWLSPVMVILRNANQTLLPEPLTESQMSWILSISNLVDLIAFLFCGYLVDNLGRKYSMILACVPRIIMCILFIFASQVWMLLLGRAICGLSDAFVVTVVATYVSEIASKEIRGGLGTVPQIWANIGSIIMLAIGPFVSYNAINAIFTAVIVITCIPLLVIPESPYFLYSKGHSEKAVRLLTSLRGSESLALEEISEYNQTNEKINKIELFKDRTVLKTIAKVSFLAMCSQLTGNTYVGFHLQTIFELTNTSVSSAVSSLVIGFIQLFASFCTIYLSDRFGRKPVMETALAGQAAGMIGLGIFFKLTQENYEITGFLNYLPLISITLSVYCHSAGLGSLLWIQTAELFDGTLRAFGVSSAVFTACLFSFLVVRYMTSLMHIIGIASTYWMFAGFCIMTCCFIQFFIPETKGKSFLQIQKDLRNKESKIKA